MNTTTQREKAKQALYEALKTSGGDTKNKNVESAIARLASLNPTNAPLADSKLIEGNWLLINAPNFPGRLADTQSRYVYTLGRLAFNMFEPAKLLVEIERVMQPVFPTGNGNERTHDIVVEFKIIERNTPQLGGIIKNLAICTPKSEDALQVEFTGGELMPLETQDSKQLQQWLTVFGRDYRLSLKEKLMSLVTKWMFGISKVSPLDPQTGKRVFTMNKSPQGMLKILYLDEELRITKGNRETVLVCQRLKN